MHGIATSQPTRKNDCTSNPDPKCIGTRHGSFALRVRSIIIVSACSTELKATRFPHRVPSRNTTSPRPWGTHTFANHSSSRSPCFGCPLPTWHCQRNRVRNRNANPSPAEPLHVIPDCWCGKTHYTHPSFPGVRTLFGSHSSRRWPLYSGPGGLSGVLVSNRETMPRPVQGSNSPLHFRRP